MVGTVDCFPPEFFKYVWCMKAKIRTLSYEVFSECRYMIYETITTQSEKIKTYMVVRGLHSTWSGKILILDYRKLNMEGAKDVYIF